MDYDYYRRQGAWELPLEQEIASLKRDLSNIQKIKDFEKAMEDLAPLLENLPKELKPKIKKAAKAYEAMLDAQFDEDILEQSGLLTPPGDDYIDFAELAGVVRNSRKLVGASKRWESATEKKLRELEAKL